MPRFATEAFKIFISPMNYFRELSDTLKMIPVKQKYEKQQKTIP
jgi:hypothetical protein